MGYLIGYLIGSAFLGASLTVGLAFLWLRDLELALLLAPTGGILAAAIVAIVVKAPAMLEELPPKGAPAGVHDRSGPGPANA